MASDIENQFPMEDLDDGNASMSRPGQGFRYQTSELMVEIPHTRTGSAVKKMILSTPLLLIYIFAAVVTLGFPLYGPLYMMFINILPEKYTEKILKNLGFPVGSAQGSAGVYHRSKRKDPLTTLYCTPLMRLVCLVTWLFVLCTALSLWVSSLKRHTLLGSPLWKWSLMGLSLAYSYLEALSLVSTLVSVVVKLVMKREAYYYHTIMLRLSCVMYFAIILLLWLLCLGNQLASTQAFEYVTWVCVSLLVGSFLWLLKDLVLLKWKAHAIYPRFEPRILINAIKYFYLALILEDSFEIRIYGHLMLRVWNASCEETPPTDFSAAKHISSTKATFWDVRDFSQLLTYLAEIVTSQEDAGIPQQLGELEQTINYRVHTLFPLPGPCTMQDLINLVGIEQHSGILEIGPLETKRVTVILHKIVLEDCSLDEITSDDLKKWLVDAHKNCVSMGRTLIDANVIVNRLDTILCCIIIVVVAMLWLLVMGFATTKVLITIATPLLLSTYIFGDTTKTFLQGFMFCYFVHPFDVGDLCIIDQAELEVKAVSVLTTTFVQVGTEKKVVFPNAVLATKQIDNLGWQPDPTDFIEVTLASSTKSKDLIYLEGKLHNYFKDNTLSYRESHKMRVTQIGETIKVKLDFTHVLSIDEMTHSQCFEKKSKQRSDILMAIKQFLEESQTSPSDTMEGAS